MTQEEIKAAKIKLTEGSKLYREQYMQKPKVEIKVTGAKDTIMDIHNLKRSELCKAIQKWEQMRHQAYLRHDFKAMETADSHLTPLREAIRELNQPTGHNVGVKGR